mgnify:CR=1 FL=1
MVRIPVKYALKRAKKLDQYLLCKKLKKTEHNYFIKWKTLKITINYEQREKNKFIFLFRYKHIVKCQLHIVFFVFFFEIDAVFIIFFESFQKSIEDRYNQLLLHF